MKKAKPKKSKTTKAIRSAKSAVRRTGAGLKRAAKKAAARLAWRERLGQARAAAVAAGAEAVASTPHGSRRFPLALAG